MTRERDGSFMLSASDVKSFDKFCSDCWRSNVDVIFATINDSKSQESTMQISSTFNREIRGEILLT